MHLLFSYARRAEPPLSKGDVVPPGYPSGSGETGGDTPLSSARRTRPRRGGAGRGVKVRQSWTFTGNLMRPAAAGLSALLAEGKIGRKWRTQSVRNSHACGMTA